ncbi:MAG: hypothetical protein KL787_11250 [Taibaiella sp.]|nr:hypothetical protein [Taibaiella sp.]
MRFFLSLSILFFLWVSPMQGKAPTEDVSGKDTFYLQSRRVHILSYEPLGNGFLSSFNYDVRFNKTHKGLGAKAGIGFYPFVTHVDGAFTLPVHINYLWGNKSHKVELGLGATFFFPHTFGRRLELYPDMIFPSWVIGYRYYAPRSRFALNAGLSFVLILPVPSIGFGFRL